MSTTFYLKRIPTKSEKKAIIDALNADDFENASELFNKNVDKRIEFAHRSGGWLMNIYIKPNTFQPTIEGIIKYANDNNYIVIDEYGETYSIEDFISEVIEWNDNPKNTMFMESYYNTHADAGHYFKTYCEGDFMYFENLGYNVNMYGEFFSNGLRFTIADRYSDNY